MKLPALLAALALIGCAVLGASAIGATIGPAPSPQRSAAEQWVADFNAGNQRAACELQTVKEATGQPCEKLSTVDIAHCPKEGSNPKPPYRKGEIRAPGEQVGEFIEESPTRGFVVINAQVKASKQRGALGLEQVEGSWRVTYLRKGAETFALAGNSWQSEGWHKLWVSNWCPTSHPQWETKKKR
jgi:hypothetical protein